MINEGDPPFLLVTHPGKVTMSLTEEEKKYLNVMTVMIPVQRASEKSAVR